MKEIFVTTEDNVKIAFNHYDSDRDAVMIIVHGWYMCKDTRPFRNISEDFFKNYDVITMDLRGHGKSSGWFTFTSNETKDLCAVVNYAKERYPKIALMGFSLGGALAIIHAATYKDIDRLITISAPCDFNRIENHCWKPEAFIPTFQKFDMWENRNVRPGNIFLEKIRPIDIVQDISPIPSLFLAGKKDPTVHPWHTEELFEKAGEPRVIEIFEDGFHAEDLYLNSRDRFMQTCRNWLNQPPHHFTDTEDYTRTPS